MFFEPLWKEPGTLNQTESAAVLSSSQSQRRAWTFISWNPQFWKRWNLDFRPSCFVTALDWPSVVTQPMAWLIPFPRDRPVLSLAPLLLYAFCCCRPCFLSVQTGYYSRPVLQMGTSLERPPCWMPMRGRSGIQPCYWSALMQWLISLHLSAWFIRPSNTPSSPPCFVERIGTPRCALRPYTGV